MVADGEMYKQNHLYVLEARLAETITEVAQKTARETELVEEVAEAEAVIRDCYNEMYGVGWDAPPDDAPQFGEFKTEIVRPPTPERVPRRYRGTQGALRMAKKELEQVQQDLRYLVVEQKLLRKRIWVAKLLRFRSFTGHTALAWAAALDHDEIVDVLYTHGGNISVDDDVLIASADLIKASFKYYHWKTSAERAEIASVVLRFSRDALELVNLMVVLKRRRAIRAGCRVPVCEALYNSRCAC